MVQAKFTVEEAQAQFLSNFKEYGFKDKSSMLRAAVEYFRKVIELKELKKSAPLVGSRLTSITIPLFSTVIPAIRAEPPRSAPAGLHLRSIFQHTSLRISSAPSAQLLF